MIGYIRSLLIDILNIGISEQSVGTVLAVLVVKYSLNLWRAAQAPNSTNRMFFFST